MQTLWRGAISFGLVSVPVRLYAATEDHDIRFHQVHRTDHGRIRYRRVCEECGQQVEYADIARAREADNGELVVLERDDFDELPTASGHEIEVVEFVPTAQVDPILFNRSYYVEPEPRAVKPYVLLREALVETDRIAIARITLRQRESLAALRVRDDVIVVQTMLWADEVRATHFDVLDTDVSLRRQEAQMASSLVDSLSTDFDPGRYTDTYTEALRELIAERATSPKGKRRAARPAKPAASDNVTDLTEVLRRSVEESRSKRAASGSRGKRSATAAEAEPAQATEASRPKRASGRRGKSA